MNLHVLNGDATLLPFKASGIVGDVIVWREIVSEGPVKDVENAELFKMRADFICKNFNESPKEYTLKVVEEFRKFDKISKYDEVFLWLEHDLVCQINLIFILKSLLLFEHKKLFVVLFYKDEKRQKKYKGFGALTAAEIIQISKYTVEINLKAQKFASDCWSAYAGADPFKIQQMLYQIPSEFPFLKSALTAHLKRFPSIYNGLNYPQQKLMELIAHGGMDISQIVYQFLKMDFAYGITDLIVTNMLKELSPELVTLKNPVKVTEAGVRILDGEADLLSLKESNHWIGGFHLHKGSIGIRWNETLKKIQLQPNY